MGLLAGTSVRLCGPSDRDASLAIDSFGWRLIPVGKIDHSSIMRKIKTTTKPHDRPMIIGDLRRISSIRILSDTRLS
jgi:hypothetical protein